MKIAFLGSLPAASVFPPNSLRNRGKSYEHPAPWMAALLPALAKLTGWKMRVFIPHWNILRRVVVEKDGVEYEGIPVRVPMRFFRKSYYHSISLFSSPALRRWEPDFVHAFGFETGSALIATRSGLPVSCFIQGIAEYLYPYYTGRSWLDKKVGCWGEAKAVKKVNWMIAETEFAKQWALKKNPSAHVSVIPHPLREEFLEQGNPSYEKNFVTVGGLDERKAVDTIIRAFAQLSDQSARLTVVGSGPQMSELEQLSETLGVAGRVVFKGALDKEGVIGELNKARAFIIASRMDTSPNVLTEAHGIGLPVIGTDVGGIPEMIDQGKDGWVVGMDDFEAMAECMEMTLSDDELVRKMGAFGREKVRQLNDPERVANAHIDFFEKVRHDLSKR